LEDRMKKIVKEIKVMNEEKVCSEIKRMGKVGESDDGKV